MENPIKMDDLGVPPFLETPIYKPSFGHHDCILGGGTTPTQGVSSVYLSAWLTQHGSTQGIPNRRHRPTRHLRPADEFCSGGKTSKTRLMAEKENGKTSRKVGPTNVDV